MIYLLIAAGLCFLAAIIIFFSIPPYGGDGYMGQGLMATFSFIASLVFLAVAALTWLWQHLSWV
jgi:hypothetical protein